MHFLFTFCQWMEQTSVGTAVRESKWLFPALETVHHLGIVSVIAGTAMLDARLMGVAMRRQPFSQVAARVLPYVWGGFGVNLLTGFLLFSSISTKMYDNVAFRMKMLLILLAGVNALVFEVTLFRGIAKWDDAPATPLGAKAVGVLSLLLWVGVVVAGRWIGFV
jgi:uncharacterized protein DUF6644